MRKQIGDIIKEEVIKTISYHVKWYLQKIPTVQELENIIDYYYSDDVQAMIHNPNFKIYQILLAMEYDVNE